MTDKNMLYVEIAKRAEKSELYHGELVSLIMDIESADLKFNMRLNEWLEADDYNFAHDIYGILSNIDRSKFPATDFGLFVPRFAQ